ncbi:ABC transporter substrate-binding protein [Pseudohalocynthiibacter sp. F2068]|uniref:ABC transporter substrate-binding protein n=1 Tax=Pseudohalocynthiibacter sp. F2068 TaxID=2926418 RepID=UPI001FF1F949|nr:ABC transporter substrate-binding protein [Pseudohalocynthiibacter sp. F2068]MCK0103308.1 ABC transporter substrate-binding protein [Pseudohalocynthiibacter sp. F2068]
MNTSIKSLLVASALSAVTALAAHAEALKLAHSTWVGYGPFYIAQEKGFFTEEGVEIELTVMENTPLKMGALMAGRIDIVASTADEFPTYMRDGKPLRYILAVDNSNGGDGVVSNKDIATVADLKGRTVAFEEGSVSQFFINALLRREGLTQDDIEMVNMTATDAGVAFTAGRVDAAVTWEPSLSQGAATEHGKILVSSSETPGLIVDVVAVLGSTADEHEEELKAFVRAWQRALDFLETNPDEAYQIMAVGVGGWLEDPNEFKAAASGIQYLDISTNLEMFGTADAPGILTDTISNAITIWGDLGRIKVEGLQASDLIDTSFLQ